jgi:hypothetical protein
VDRKRSSLPVSTSSIQPSKQRWRGAVPDPSSRTKAHRITWSSYGDVRVRAVKVSLNFAKISVGVTAAAREAGRPSEGARVKAGPQVVLQMRSLDAFRL